EPAPSNEVSIIPCRSIASETACRTRTSLNGSWSVRIEMWVSTLLGNSAVRRFGRFCLSVSLICTQSVRLMLPGNSHPRSYLPARKAAMREDRHRHRIGEDVEQPRERLLHDELYRVAIDDFDVIDRFQHVRRRVALDREEPFHRVAHILGRELAPVDWRPGMPADTLA